jgi:hypothetical protein
VNVVDGPLTTLLGGERPIGYVAVRGGWAMGHVCGPGRRPLRGGREGALSQEARHSGQASGTDPAHDTPGMANLKTDAAKRVVNGLSITLRNVVNGPCQRNH